MTSYIVKRHFVNSRDTLSVFSEQLEKMKTAVEISKAKSYDFKFGLKLTVDEGNISDGLMDEVYDALCSVPKEIRFMYEEKDRGAAESYRKIIFNPDFWKNPDAVNPDIIVDACLDQYMLDSEESLGRANELIQKVRVNGALYANGSRDVPVVLARYDKNSRIRAIHELYHSLAIGSEKLKVDETPKNVTPAYAELGESTSGFYVINIAHPLYPVLAEKASPLAGKESGRFAIDYYTAIKSAEIAEIEKGYVSSYKNAFYDCRSEEDELSGIKNLISSCTKTLGSTDIAGALFKALAAEANAHNLYDFFPADEVAFVRQTMLEGFGN
jgi:hypothetical protein